MRNDRPFNALPGLSGQTFYAEPGRRQWQIFRRDAPVWAQAAL